MLHYGVQKTTVTYLQISAGLHYPSAPVCHMSCRYLTHTYSCSVSSTVPESQFLSVSLSLCVFDALPSLVCRILYFGLDSMFVWYFYTFHSKSLHLPLHLTVHYLIANELLRDLNQPFTATQRHNNYRLDVKSFRITISVLLQNQHLEE